MTRPTAPARTRLPMLALLSLAVTTFLSVTIEMLPTGVLTLIADELGESASAIGALVSVYAFTVVLTAAPLTHLTRRVERHRLVLGVLLVYTVGSFAAAIAPNYAVLLIARLVSGLAHGIFWAVAGAYAAYLVPKEQIARATSIVLIGGSTAYILGLPLGTWLGQQLGWRMSFAVLGALVLASFVVMIRALPRVPATEATLHTESIPLPSLQGSVVEPVAGRGALRRLFARFTPTITERSVTAVVMVCLITAIIMIGQFAFYTYIAVYVKDAAGIPDAQLSTLLFLYGAMGLIGTLGAGHLNQALPRATQPLVITGVIVAVLVLGAWPSVTWLVIAAIALWGLMMGLLPATLQTRLLLTAPTRVRDTANAFYTTAFNVGIGGGAMLGGLVLVGHAATSLAFVEAGFMAVGLLLTILTLALIEASRRRTVARQVSGE